MTKRELMAKALEEQKKIQANKKPAPAPPKATPNSPTQFKVGEKPPKSQRSKAAREARAKTRGRVPHKTKILATWYEAMGKWGGIMTVSNGPSISHEAPGVFQLLEELDIMYWEWVAKEKGGAT